MVCSFIAVTPWYTACSYWKISGERDFGMTTPPHVFTTSSIIHRCSRLSQISEKLAGNLDLVEGRVSLMQWIRITAAGCNLFDNVPSNSFKVIYFIGWDHGQISFHIILIVVIDAEKVQKCCSSSSSSLTTWFREVTSEDKLLFPGECCVVKRHMRDFCFRQTDISWWFCLVFCLQTTLEEAFGP